VLQAAAAAVGQAAPRMPAEGVPSANAVTNAEILVPVIAIAGLVGSLLLALVGSLLLALVYRTPWQEALVTALVVVAACSLADVTVMLGFVSYLVYFDENNVLSSLLPWYLFPNQQAFACVNPSFPTFIGAWRPYSGYSG
jgi:NhaP-type Na+/H+ or K+/H+ antiporter